MSKVKIEGNASGTGTLTITAPNTNTDRSLTLPDGAGEILTDASTLSSSNMPSGSVLQVVTASDSVEYGGNSSSWMVATTPAVTITPSSTSSKISLLFQTEVENGYSGNKMNVDIRRVVGGTTTDNLTGEQQGFGRILADTTNHRYAATFHYVDTPNTTSAVTYYLTCKSEDGSNVWLGGTYVLAVTTAMEIQG